MSSQQRTEAIYGCSNSRYPHQHISHTLLFIFRFSLSSCLLVPLFLSFSSISSLFLYSSFLCLSSFSVSSFFIFVLCFLICLFLLDFCIPSCHFFIFPSFIYFFHFHNFSSIYFFFVSSFSFLLLPFLSASLLLSFVSLNFCYFSFHYIFIFISSFLFFHHLFPSYFFVKVELWEIICKYDQWLELDKDNVRPLDTVDSCLESLVAKEHGISWPAEFVPAICSSKSLWRRYIAMSLDFLEFIQCLCILYKTQIFGPLI